MIQHTYELDFSTLDFSNLHNNLHDNHLINGHVILRVIEESPGLNRMEIANRVHELSLFQVYNWLMDATANREIHQKNGRYYVA